MSEGVRLVDDEANAETESRARKPRPAEIFEPVPDSWNDPEGPFVAGPARIVLERVGPKEFRVPVRFGYCDPVTGESFVIPRCPTTYTSDLSSAPPYVQWLVPIHGRHFNAWMVHDGLVEDKLFEPDNPGEGDGYFGKKVSREEADRITRDAIREFGGGFVLRWLAWVGMLAATIVGSPEGIVGSTRWHKVLFWIFGLFILLFGINSTIEMLGGGWGLLPWLESDKWFVRFLLGTVAATIIPLGLSALWWRRWRFGAILGIGFALLLPALATTGLVTLGLVVTNRVLAHTRYGRPRYLRAPTGRAARSRPGTAAATCGR